MENFKIYTSGAIKNVTHEMAYEWRDMSKEYLENCESLYNVKVFNPNKHFNYDELVPKTEKQCKAYFMYQLEQSNLILVNLNNSDKSIGTAMEIQKAVDYNIPIIGFGTYNMNAWEYDDCDIVFETLEEALDYIRFYYINY